MLARSKFNSKESKISETLIKNETSHEDFMTITNKERTYQELKESIRMIKSQGSDINKLIWLKKVKGRTDEIIKRNEFINNSLNLKYKTVSTHCLMCKKNTMNVYKNDEKSKKWC